MNPTFVMMACISARMRATSRWPISCTSLGVIAVVVYLRVKKAYIFSPSRICHAPTCFEGSRKVFVREEFFETLVGWNDVRRDCLLRVLFQTCALRRRDARGHTLEGSVEEARLRVCDNLFINLRGHALHDDFGQTIFSRTASRMSAMVWSM